MDSTEAPVVRSQSVDLSCILNEPLSSVDQIPCGIDDPSREQDVSLPGPLFVASVPTTFHAPLEPPPLSVIGVLSSRTLDSSIISQSEQSNSTPSLTYSTSEGPSEDDQEDESMSSNVSARSSTSTFLNKEQQASSEETTPRFFLPPRTPLEMDPDGDLDACEDTSQNSKDCATVVSSQSSDEVKEPNPPSPSGLERIQVVGTAIKEPVSLLVPLALVSDPQPTATQGTKSREPEENKIGLLDNQVTRSRMVDISKLLVAKIPKDKLLDTVSTTSKSSTKRSLTSGRTSKVHAEQGEHAPKSSKNSKKKKDHHKKKSKSLKTVLPIEQDELSLLSEVSALSKSPMSQTPPRSTSPRSPTSVNKVAVTAESRIHTVNIEDKKSPPFLKQGTTTKVHPVVSDHVQLEPEITFVHRNSTATSPPIPIQPTEKLNTPTVNAEVLPISDGSNPQEAGTSTSTDRVLPFPGLQIEIPDPKDYIDAGISPIAESTTIGPEKPSKWGNLREKVHKQEVPRLEAPSSARSRGISAWRNRRRSSTFSSRSHSSRSSSSGSIDSRFNTHRRNSKYSQNSKAGRRGEAKRGKAEKAVIKFTMTEEEMAQVSEGCPYMHGRIHI